MVGWSLLGWVTPDDGRDGGYRQRMEYDYDEKFRESMEDGLERALARILQEAV